MSRVTIFTGWAFISQKWFGSLQAANAGLLQTSVTLDVWNPGCTHSELNVKLHSKGVDPLSDADGTHKLGLTAHRTRPSEADDG